MFSEVTLILNFYLLDFYDFLFNRGKRSGVVSLYFRYSGLSPHFSKARRSSMGVPLTFVKRIYMNMGDIQATFSRPEKQETPKMAIPVHRRISPK